MANCIFGTPTWSDVGVLYTPTFSGGSWAAALPLTNLADSRLHRVARSSSAAVADTVFTCDLLTDRAVRVLALPKHTLSEAGTVRVRGFTAVPILDALDFSTGWTSVGTPTRVAASYSGSGADGVPLDLIGDDDGAALERYYRIVTFTGNGTKVVSFRAKQGSSSVSSVELYDTTALAIRMRCTITWTAGVPSPSVGTGTLISSTLIGDGVYRVVCLSTSVTAANTFALYVEPVSNSIAATGTSYMGDFKAWDATTDQLVYDTGCELGIPSGIDAEEREGINVGWQHITSAAQSARIWRVNINDTANAAGYVDLGRLIIAGGFQPEVNISYGAGLGFETNSTSEDTDGGATIHDARAVRRTMTGHLEMMPESDAYDAWFRLVMRHGTSRQLFFCYDPDDTTQLHRRAFLCTFADLNAIEEPYHARFATAFSLREAL